MRKTRIGINGFGRIGRTVVRASLGDTGIDFAAINELGDLPTMAHLLKHDSVHGKFQRPVEIEGSDLLVAGDRIRVLREPSPERIPWGMLGVDVVLECTGRFTSRDKAEKHLAAGAPKVIITAPAKGPDVTIVLGVNEGMYDPVNHKIISNASCTTNCAAPVAKVLNDKFGIKRGFLNTTHAMTNDQQLLDLPHDDLRRARAAGLSMIPTKTGAAQAIGEVLPALKGRFDGLAVRVPTHDVSLIDFVLEVEKSTTVEEVNAALKEAAEGSLKGILDATNEPLVSIDYTGSSFSAIVDMPLTRVLGGTMIKVFAWYDNEWAYACRVRDLAKMIGPQPQAQ